MEENWRGYLTNYPAGIRVKMKMNVIARVNFELAYYGAEVEYDNHYATILRKLTLLYDFINNEETSLIWWKGYISLGINNFFLQYIVAFKTFRHERQ